MHKSQAAILIPIVFCFGAFAQSKVPTGFKDIAFGTSLPVAKEQIIAEFAMKRAFPVPESPYDSRTGIELSEAKDQLILAKFPLGGKKYTVTLFFSRNSRFYAFLVKGRLCSGAWIRNELANDVAFLSRVFRARYGGSLPETAFDVTEAEAGNEVRNAIREDDRYSILTGAAREKGRSATDVVFAPIAIVCDKLVRDEPRDDAVAAAAAKQKPPAPHPQKTSPAKTATDPVSQAASSF